MQLVRTSFNLRSDLRWSEDVYEECIYAWINGSGTKYKKNYEALLRVLPRHIDINRVPNGKYSFAGETLEYESFSFKKKDYLGFLFTNSSLGRCWKTRVAFCRTSKHVQCFVSLDCELGKGSSLPAISKPKILDYLIKFQDGDGGVDISEKAHIIGYNDISMAKSALTSKLGNVLPIVYLSCSERTHSLIPNKVSKQLFGVAHVFAEKDRTIFDRLKLDMGNLVFPKKGEIGICYVDQPINVFNRYSVVDWCENPEVLVQDIFLKILRQNLSLKFNFTWDDFLEARSKYKIEESELDSVKNKALVEKLRTELDSSKEMSFEQSKMIKKLMNELEKISKERDLYKDEHSRFETLEKQYESCKNECETWEKLALESDKELTDTKNALHMATSKCDALQQNFESAWGKNVQNLPLIMPKDVQMFPDEYKCQLISILHLAKKNVRETDISPKIRQKDIIDKILDSNDEAVKVYECYSEKIKVLESVAREQRLKTGDGCKAMKPFGMEFVKKGNNHGKIRYVKDERECYLGSEASTPSETSRGGKNQASDLIKAMLWSD